MKRGMVLGKFLPPHKGHEYLINFASQFADELTVVVGTLKAEPIPGEVRFQWMKEMFPQVNVVHLTDENPQYPEEHDDFWNIWKNSLQRILPWEPDYVFASEEYGKKLAEVLGAEFIPCDPGRQIVPVSGTAVRKSPMANWHYIADTVKPWYLKKVCICGPESCGKSTLTQNLAEHFNTVFVPEYARTYLEMQKGELNFDDMIKIAEGQSASEKALLSAAEKLIFTDTDTFSTTLWSEFLYEKCDERVYSLAAEHKYDLYLLLDVDVPWVADEVRYLPENRRDFFMKFEEKLKKEGRRYQVIKGDWDERFAQAAEYCGRLLKGENI